MPHYYVETDGEVYLVQEDGAWRFPAHKESLPFPIEELFSMMVLGQEVLFCKPSLNYHPHWCHKDELIGWENVDPIVRQAVNLSLPRVVAEAIIVEDQNILLAKATRGFNKGRWTLPGGFVNYGESPDKAVAREVQEEIGVDSKVNQLLSLESFIGEGSFIHWHMCFYDVTVLSHEFKPAADEIELVEWFPLEKALKAIPFKNIQRVLRKQYC